MVFYHSDKVTRPASLRRILELLATGKARHRRKVGLMFSLWEQHTQRLGIGKMANPEKANVVLGSMWAGANS